MSKSIPIASLPQFDAALFLNDERAIAVYVRDIQASTDPVLVASALEDVARARHMNHAAGRTNEQA